MPRRRPSLAAVLFAAFAAAASAQEVRLYRESEAVDPQEVARILEHRPMKMRSIRLLDDPAPAAAAAPAAPQAPLAAAGTGSAPAADEGDAPRSGTKALALPVQFAFDSAEILPSARQQLDALAKGIRMLPSSRAVVIEGHTDAAGPEAYNEQLSHRRAHAVKRYLVATHGIEASRLRAVGFGEHEPLPGRDPRARENRRVQFRGE
ncbi:MAG TPA: OmpA family protein [Albitalea sp.]